MVGILCWWMPCYTFLNKNEGTTPKSLFRDSMTDFAVFGFFGKFLQSFKYMETEHMWFPNKRWFSQFLCSLSLSVNILLTPAKLGEFASSKLGNRIKKHPLDPKCPWKMKVLHPQYMGYISPQNMKVSRGFFYGCFPTMGGFTSVNPMGWEALASGVV